MEQATYYWFLQQRSKHVPLNTDVLREKAIFFHKQFCSDTTCKFKASYGWAQKFNGRHQIRNLAISGEKLSANIRAVEPFKDSLLKTITEMGLTLDQLYNADESSLYWKMLPSKTLAANDETSALGRKVAKDRVAFMPCSNLTGSNRPALQIIGKSKRPRCFRSRTLPKNIVYCSSKSAWQNRYLFHQYYEEVFKPSVLEYSAANNIPAKALLLLDNASCHNQYHQLGDENIKIIFLPPNCNAVLQPMDQSVIQPVKVKYRKKLLQQLLLAGDLRVNF